MKITSFSPNFLTLVEHFECSGDITKFLTSYKDGAGVWTIGRGTTIYPDGTHVKQGDTCTIEQAREYLTCHCEKMIPVIDKSTPDSIKQGQFDAIGSFIYNMGPGAWQGSTLRAVIEANPDNFTAVETQLLRWNNMRVNGKLEPSDGLTRRRKSEAFLYKNGFNHPTFFL